MPKIVCFPFTGERLGGSHISSLKLMEGLDGRRYRAIAVVHSSEGPVASFLTQRGVEIRHIPLVFRSAYWNAATMGLPSLVQLCSFLRANRVAVVHTNDGVTHAIWALATKLSGARHVWHHRAGPKGRGVRFIAPLIANAIVSVSNFAKPASGLARASRKWAVIPSPFDLSWIRIDRDACRKSALVQLELAEPVILLGFFANLEYRKRPLLFVDAVAELCRRVPELSVFGLIFGEARHGLDREARALADARGIGSKIRLMGFRPDPERWLAACDCLAVPAVDEPFGRTLIEAMLVGTPVVAVDSGGNSEAIESGHNGLLVPPNDAGALAQGILSLIRDRTLYARIVGTARNTAVHRFGIDRHAAAIMNIYDNILSNRRTHSNQSDRSKTQKDAASSASDF